MSNKIFWICTLIWVHSRFFEATVEHIDSMSLLVFTLTMNGKQGFESGGNGDESWRS